MDVTVAAASVLVNVTLVVVTWRYVRLTRDIASASSKAALAAERSANEARRAASAAEGALKIETMPLLLVRWMGDFRVTSETVGFYLQNDGRSTALNIVLTFEGKQERTEAMPAGSRLPSRNKVRNGKVPRVTAGAPIKVTYSDLFGRRYRTINEMTETGEAVYTIEQEYPLGGWGTLSRPDFV